MKRYFPQLEGLRALAALEILVHHYWPNSIRFDLSKGRMGVDLFFVLSGFLITRSLLKARETTADPAGVTFEKFQRRRLLRIIPPFYLTLALACYMPSERTISLAWHAGFLSNIYFVLEQRFVGCGGHLWALAIEQQFYWFWPVLVLWLPRRWVGGAAFALVGGGILFRVLSWIYAYTPMTINSLTPTAFEALGMGSALGVWLQGREETPARFSPWMMGVGLIGLILWIPGFFISGEEGPGYVYLLLTLESARALVLTWLIAQAVWGIPGWLGASLGSAPARVAGAWSYGIYLSHNFFFGMFRAAPHKLPFLSGYDSQAALALLATVAWAAAGYHFLEKPLNVRPSVEKR